MSMQRHKQLGAVAALAGITLLATSCAAGVTNSVGTASPHSQDRVAISYEGGIAVLDGTDLKVLADFESEKFTRLNAAGDGKNVFVSTSAGFQLLDTLTPQLSNVVYPASAPGHVVRHGGTTVLYDDGSGKSTIISADELAKATDSLPVSGSYTAPSPHHGVSIVLTDGTLLTTQGDATSRSGAIALEPHDDHWHDFASSEECPGIHGEGTAAGEAVVFGCEDGALLFHDGHFEKLDAPDKYGRMGNAYVSETSPIVVGDYKNDPDAEGYLLNAVALIDTAAHDFKVVDLPESVQYTFRGVARGPDDQAYILSTDGSIHVLDPESGLIVQEFPVIDAWDGPKEWQDAHPAIVAHGDIAYVTDPAKKEVHRVDLSTGKVTASSVLEAAPNEIAVTVAAH